MDVVNSHPHANALPTASSAFTVWLVQMERANEHDADVAASERDALDMVVDHLQRSVGFGIEPVTFLASEDYRDDVRARAGADGVFYTIEQRQFAAR
jgi:hypothetical protein